MYKCVCAYVLRGPAAFYRIKILLLPRFGPRTHAHIVYTCFYILAYYMYVHCPDHASLSQQSLQSFQGERYVRRILTDPAYVIVSTINR